MDKQTLAVILERHISGNKLDLPADALGSDAVNAQFALFLPGEDLTIDPIANRQDEDDSIILTGISGNSLFKGASVTARFVAADSAGLILQAQAASGWALAEAFPILEHTFAAELKFKDAIWTLSAQTGNAAADGLTFQGTIDFAQSLGVFEFLLGSIDKTIGGSIDSIKDGVPLMRLAGAALDGTTLGFIKLGAIRLALLAQAVPPSREGGATQAGVVLEISTALDFQAQGKTVEIPLTSGIYSSDSAIRFNADTSQIINAGLDDLSALFNSIDLSDLAFGDFRLEDSVALSELSFVVDPLADAKLQSVALTVNSKKNWNLLTRPGGDGAFVTLENPAAFLGSSAPFAEEDFSASLKGDVLIGDACIAMHASADSDSTTVEGILDSASHLSLGDIARHFLGEIGAFTPELSLNHLEFTVQPGQSYQLTSEVDDLWSIPLGDKTLDIESLAVDWQYAVGSDTKADIKGVIQFAGAEIDVGAKYDTATGWNFSGALAEGDTVEIGDLLADLFYFFNVEPPQFVETIKLNELAVDFNTASKSFDFTLGGGLPVDDKWLEITLKIAISENNDEFTFALSGTLTIGDYEFDLAFLHGSSDNRFVAAYSYTGAPTSLPLQSFFADHVSSTVAEFVPQNLSVDLKDILFAFDSTNVETDASGEPSPQTTFVFAFDLGTSINLSNLPLVGKELSAVQTVSVDDLRLFAASAELTGAQINAFNQIIPDGITKLPEPTDENSASGTNGNGQPSTDSTAKSAIEQGLTVSAKINFGGDQRALSLTVGGADSPPAGNSLTSSASSAARSVAVAEPPDDAHWFTVQKMFGPVHFERIGVRYEDAVLTFLLDAALSAAGLTLSLEGLSVGSPLDKFAPQFNLNGLGIDYSNGAAEIGAAFLRNPLTEEYSGTAVIKTGQFNLAAIGSYSKLEGHPSLFIYGILDYPIGGPAFFFVTGLAAGFGYNRALIVPPVGEIAAFPLVAEAADPPGGEIDLTTELTSLQTYVPPSVGDIFLAVGVKFTSFKMIDSFALLAFSFGTRFEIDVLGLSTLIVPTPVDGDSATPLAEAQMALKATFIPDEGFLGVSAQLTSASYILSKACRLTGGYAFYSWFSGAHEGDFVQTLGGYHPSFNVPAHYPQVPRLGFNWRVDDHISITGALYYALTPSALMAGGFLQAVWDDGDLSAWFKAGADFLISWKPYHYDVEIYVDMGVSYTFNFFGRHTITVDIGADLHIWGPEFAGHAHIHLWIVSFDVSFGSTSAAAPPPLKWDEFRNSFLPPKNEDICTINVKNGLVKGTKDRNDLGVINPKYLSVVTHSVIPSTEAATGSQTPDKMITVGDVAQIGIGSMAIAPGAFVSRHNITVARDNFPSESDFTFTPVRKNVPAGLWGDKLMPELNGQAVIENALTGFEITPAALPTPGATMLIDRRNLMYADPQIFAGAFGFENLDEFEADGANDSDRKREIENTILEDSVAVARQSLLNSLGFDAEFINLSATVADTFIIPPLVQK